MNNPNGMEEPLSALPALGTVVAVIQPSNPSVND
jgi:hypothetical protein